MRRTAEVLVDIVLGLILAGGILVLVWVGYLALAGR